MSAKFTGGTIHTTGGYVYHIFTEPGEYTLTKIVEGPVEVDVLIVAGGGGGGRGFPGAVQPHGGGGAGGVISVLGHVVEDANIPVEVGAGGAGGDGEGGVDSSDGDRSILGDLVAFGGGRGGGRGGDGGSGGGSNFAAGVGGAGTEGQGHDGGFGTTNIPPYNSGGGGGAGAPGANGTSSESSGAGGDGIALESIGWGDLEALGLPTAVGGGGGGGVRANGSRSASLGGFGGGGAGGGIIGSTPLNGEPGAPNTGGGGGAGANRNVSIATNGGDGGSGLVVIRYVDEPEPEGPWVPCPAPAAADWEPSPEPGAVLPENATDFSEYATGQAPGDWTQRFNTGNVTWAVHELEGAIGGKVLRGTRAGGGLPPAISWDAIGLTTDVEILVKLRTRFEGSTNTHIGVVCQGADGSDGIFLSIGLRGGHRFGDPTMINIRRWSDFGGVTLQAEAFAWNVHDWYWIRLRRSGDNIRGWVWADGHTAPSTPQLEQTTPTPSAPGWVGIVLEFENGIREIDFFSVGLGGNPAPSPGGTQDWQACPAPPALPWQTSS